MKRTREICTWKGKDSDGDIWWCNNRVMTHPTTRAMLKMCAYHQEACVYYHAGQVTSIETPNDLGACSTHFISIRRVPPRSMTLFRAPGAILARPNLVGTGRPSHPLAPTRRRRRTDYGETDTWLSDATSGSEDWDDAEGFERVINDGLRNFKKWRRRQRLKLRTKKQWARLRHRGAVSVQTQVRAMLARRELAKRKAALVADTRIGAAVKLQRLYRGRYHRKRFLDDLWTLKRTVWNLEEHWIRVTNLRKVRRRAKEEAAAIKLQGFARYIESKHFMSILCAKMHARELKMVRNDAMAIIWTIYLGFKGRKRARERKAEFDRDTFAATQIQRRWRGVMGRTRYEEAKALYGQWKVRTNAAIVIQRIAVGYLGRQYFRWKRWISDLAATQIQRIWRGIWGRIIARKRAGVGPRVWMWFMPTMPRETFAHLTTFVPYHKRFNLTKFLKNPPIDTLHDGTTYAKDTQVNAWEEERQYMLQLADDMEEKFREADVFNTDRLTRDKFCKAATDSGFHVDHLSLMGIVELFTDRFSGRVDYPRFLYYARQGFGLCARHRVLVCPLCMYVSICAKCRCNKYRESSKADMTLGQSHMKTNICSCGHHRYNHRTSKPDRRTVSFQEGAAPTKRQLVTVMRAKAPPINQDFVDRMLREHNPIEKTVAVIDGPYGEPVKVKSLDELQGPFNNPAAQAMVGVAEKMVGALISKADPEVYDRARHVYPDDEEGVKDSEYERVYNFGEENAPDLLAEDGRGVKYPPEHQQRRPSVEVGDEVSRGKDRYWTKESRLLAGYPPTRPHGYDVSLKEAKFLEDAAVSRKGLDQEPASLFRYRFTFDITRPVPVIQQGEIKMTLKMADCYIYLLKSLGMPPRPSDGVEDLLANHNRLMTLIFSYHVFLDRFWRKMLHDIRVGHLEDSLPVGRKRRARVNAMLKPQPTRAEYLERVFRSLGYHERASMADRVGMVRHTKFDLMDVLLPKPSPRPKPDPLSTFPEPFSPQFDIGGGGPSDDSPLTASLGPGPSGESPSRPRSAQAVLGRARPGRLHTAPAELAGGGVLGTLDVGGVSQGYNYSSRGSSRPTTAPESWRNDELHFDDASTASGMSAGGVQALLTPRVSRAGAVPGLVLPTTGTRLRESRSRDSHGPTSTALLQSPVRGSVPDDAFSDADSSIPRLASSQGNVGQSRPASQPASLAPSVSTVIRKSPLRALHTAAARTRGPGRPLSASATEGIKEPLLARTVATNLAKLPRPRTPDFLRVSGQARHWVCKHPGCGRSFPSEWAIVTHHRQRHADRTRLATTLPKVDNLVQAYWPANTPWHNPEHNLLASKVDTEAADGKLFKCPIEGCGKRLQKEWHLQAHVRCTHQTEPFLAELRERCNGFKNASDRVEWDGEPIRCPPAPMPEGLAVPACPRHQWLVPADACEMCTLFEEMPVPKAPFDFYSRARVWIVPQPPKDGSDPQGVDSNGGKWITLSCNTDMGVLAVVPPALAGLPVNSRVRSTHAFSLLQLVKDRSGQAWFIGRRCWRKSALEVTGCQWFTKQGFNEHTELLEMSRLEYIPLEAVVEECMILHGTAAAFRMARKEGRLPARLEGRCFYTRERATDQIEAWMRQAYGFRVPRPPRVERGAPSAAKKSRRAKRKGPKGGKFVPGKATEPPMTERAKRSQKVIDDGAGGPAFGHGTGEGVMFPTKSTLHLWMEKIRREQEEAERAEKDAARAKRAAVKRKEAELARGITSLRPPRPGSVGSAATPRSKEGTPRGGPHARTALSASELARTAGDVKTRPEQRNGGPARHSLPATASTPPLPASRGRSGRRNKNRGHALAQSPLHAASPGLVPRATPQVSPPKSPVGPASKGRTPSPAAVVAPTPGARPLANTETQRSARAARESSRHAVLGSSGRPLIRLGSPLSKQADTAQNQSHASLSSPPSTTAGRKQLASAPADRRGVSFDDAPKATLPASASTPIRAVRGKSGGRTATRRRRPKKQKVPASALSYTAPSMIKRVQLAQQMPAELRGYQ